MLRMARVPTGIVVVVVRGIGPEWNLGLSSGAVNPMTHMAPAGTVWIRSGYSH